ncbi:olfactomedin-like protein 2B isoform X2 [Rhineura floridana]|uniref:olfactomedin-like protein 2B isoform X2 n=1 Tax=Rhineura floridana TaxID=261503 RepID=UPI002AC80769|nr:olfactomedin-like protein 2B isoform X2 [Rhineura floridana]
MARPMRLLCCCSAALLAAWWGAISASASPSSGAAAVGGAPLQDEADNQENILSQLLGDYDKVKAVSEGPDCQCKCVVRPLGRGACQRINEGASKPEDSYMVETITSGPECKCSCVAPPSALNPCEGDFRLKKLQEADSKDFKLAAVLEMLEGAFYGLDLLKLHSVTTKLVGRVEKLEEEVSRNLTKENKQKRQNVDEYLQEMDFKGKTNSSDSISNSLADIQSSLQRDAAAAYTLTEGKYEEVFLHNEMASEQISSAETLRYAPPAPEAKSTLPRKLHVRSRPLSQPTIIRGVTYYKAKDVETENDFDEQDELFSGDNPIDMLIEDQLLQHSYLPNSPTRKQLSVEKPLMHQSIELIKEPATNTTPIGKEASATTAAGIELLPTSAIMPPSVEPTPVSTSSDLHSSSNHFAVAAEPTATAGVSSVTNSAEEGATRAMKTVAPTATQASTIIATQNGTATRSPVVRVATTDSQTQATAEPTSAATTKAVTSPASANPSPSVTPTQGLDEEDIRNSIGQCKDTLSTISGPVTQNTYGRNEGAWMKDPLAKDERIYVTNYYYGNTLVEFRNLDSFKQGRWSNSYKLPYNWMGTGHAVFNGSLYYNRAFTRNLIKYDLKQRYVAAWAMLDDVAYEEEMPWRWRGHSDVDFAVDENGLWIIYPAINYEGFSQEVIVLSKLNANDLSTRKETTWRTGLRKNFYGNSFVICGVLYAIDSYSKKNANISYAFDTHTNTQIIPRLLFENEYSYTTQIDYNPKDRLLYAWDNGHQVTYNVMFAY